MYMLGSSCSPCCGADACAGGFSYSDPLDEGQWIPSGQWFNVPFAGQSTVTATFNSSARGKVWFFCGTYQTSNATGNATSAEQEDYDNPCNWWSYRDTSPFDPSASPTLGNWRRATSLPPSDATVFFYTNPRWTGTKTLYAAYFMGCVLTDDLTCTGYAHDSPGGAVFCNATVMGTATLTSGVTFGPGTLQANGTVVGDASFRATSNTVSPNTINGNVTTGANSSPRLNGSNISGSLSVTYRGTYTNCTIGTDLTTYETPVFSTFSVGGNATLLWSGSFYAGTITGTLTMSGGIVSATTANGAVTINGGQFDGTANSGIVANGGAVYTPTTATSITTYNNAVIYGRNSALGANNTITTSAGIEMNGSGYIWNVEVFGSCVFNGSTVVSRNPNSATSTSELFHGTCEFNGTSSVSGSQGAPFFHGSVTFNDSATCGFSVYFGDLLGTVTTHVTMNGNSRIGNSVLSSASATITFNDNACTTKSYTTSQRCPVPNSAYYISEYGWQGKTVCNGTAPAWNNCAGANTTCGCG